MPYYRTIVTHTVTELSASDIDDLNRLLTYVASKPRTFTREDLSHILEHAVLAAVQYIDGPLTEIRAMGLMAPIRSLSAYRMYVQDVAVSPHHRRQGLGRSVMEALLSYARTHHAESVDLTSTPEREPAHALYRDLGFKLRETNVYRFIIEHNEESPA